MRSVLFLIPLKGTIDLGPLGQVSVFGVGLLLALWVLFGLAFAALSYRKHGTSALGGTPAVIWAAVAAAIIAGRYVARADLPIYGYGTMLFVAFLGSAALAARRLRLEGADGEIAWDLSMWLFATGILGGRMFYVARNPEKFFGVDPATGLPRSVPEILKGLVNLPDGGLVLYGSLIFAPVAYYVFCRRRGIHPLALGDIVISSIFVGILFGRLGCLLHGCCYGDFCTLPWAIEFPPKSVPFEVLAARGWIAPGAPSSLPLHPTQVYDALNGAILTVVTLAWYPRRKRSGEVLAIGWMAYPINRFLIEYLRWDEPGILGTSLTVSQWGSLLLLAIAAGFYAWILTHPPVRQPLVVGGGAQARAASQFA
jgi:phosphatidylglycerol:prolipoprotein diacylglycerol transferase